MDTIETCATEPRHPGAEEKVKPSCSLFIKKFSIFDAKLAQQAIESITEVAEGFNNEQQDLEDSYVRQSSKTKAIQEADAQLENLSITGEKFVCTTCNFQFADREEQVSDDK